MTDRLTNQKPNDTEAVEAVCEAYGGSYELWVDPFALYELMRREARLRHAISMLAAEDISPRQRRHIAAEALRNEV